MSEAGGSGGVHGLVEGVGVPKRAISACVRAVHVGERLKEGGRDWRAGLRDSGTDARAHDRPKRRQGDPTEQREGERKRGTGRRRQAGFDCQGRQARGRGRTRLGLVGWFGLEWLFPFS
jgi:hypothetical protein